MKEPMIFMLLSSEVLLQEFRRLQEKCEINYNKFYTVLLIYL
jgi:hypothetical protein